MADDERTQAMIDEAFEIAKKPVEDRTRSDLENLAKMGGEHVADFNAAFQRIRAQAAAAGSGRDYYDDAADALTAAAQIAVHEIAGGPSIGISERRDK